MGQAGTMTGLQAPGIQNPAGRRKRELWTLPQPQSGQSLPLVHSLAEAAPQDNSPLPKHGGEIVLFSILYLT